jgi:hypothetical protein
MSDNCCQVCLGTGVLVADDGDLVCSCISDVHEVRWAAWREMWEARGENPEPGITPENSCPCEECGAEIGEACFSDRVVARLDALE